MKTKGIELDTDFIGGESPLTEVEEKALSQFFELKKLKNKKSRKSNKTQAKKQVNV